MLTKISRSRWLALGLFSAVALVIGVLWESSHGPPLQIITLPNGEQYRFAGVTWGTNHVYGSTAAGLVNRLPAPMASLVWKHAGSLRDQIISLGATGPSLCVWLQPLGTNAPPRGGRIMYAKLADDHDVEAGSLYLTCSLNFVWPLGDFSLVPRRSPVLRVCIYQPDPQGGISNEIGRVRFPNPLYGRFPQWKPEPLPTVKMAGDLEVRLVNILTGNVEKRGQSMYHQPVWRVEDSATWFDLAFHSPRGTNELWRIQSAELSDATGNTLQSFLPFHDETGRLIQLRDASGNVLPRLSDESGCQLAFSGTLWPDEAAWRLKLELKRAHGYAPEEIVTFKNVPVPKVGTTKVRLMTNFVGGMELVLREFTRNPDIMPTAVSVGYLASRIGVELPAHPDGVVVDFVEITTDTGEKLVYPSQATGWPFDSMVHVPSIPTNVHTMNITWVVQKTRSVEFLVKPPHAE